MPRTSALAAGLVVLLVASALPAPVEAANWEPDGGDWVTFRRDAAHGAASPNKAAFTTSLADLRVKWSHSSDLPFWLPPTAADMDNDGIAEVVAVMGNVEITPPPALAFEFTSGFEVLNGRTGETRWQYGPNTGNLQWYAPAIGDIDGDGEAELAFMDGQPLTGNFNTNKIFAYAADGTKLWEYSDVNWGAQVPEALASLVIADVDGETARKEVVASVLLATVTVSPEGAVEGSNPQYEVIALNGEGNVARSWRIPHDHASVASPAVADMDGDGTGDVVFGSGMQGGVLFEVGGAVVTLTEDFEDHAIEAWAGGAAPTRLWSFDTSPVNAGDVGTAPSIADLNGDGKPDVVAALGNRNACCTSNITAISNNGTQLWKRVVNSNVARPLALGDVNSDGRTDVIASTEFGTEGYRLHAYRGSDGALLWRSPAQSAYLNGVPALGDLTGDGKPEVITLQGATTTLPTRLLVFNGQTGGLLFSKDVDADDTLGGPVLADLDGDDDGRPEIVINVGSFVDSPALRHSAVVAYEPELPDLKLADLNFSAVQHNLGEAETISVTVTNSGSRPAANAVVEFRDGDLLVGSQTLTLAAGASATASTSWTPAVWGARTVSASVDPGKAIPEWTENDNRIQRNVQVRAADLTFAAVDPTFTPANPGEGQATTMGATLRNVGDRDAANVVVRFTEDDVVVGTQTVASIAAGATRAVSAAFNAGNEGTHTYEVRADPDNTIPEVSEANNAASKQLSLRFIGPDLTFALDDPRFSDPRPSPDDTITVSATVRNIGEDDAGSFVVRFLDDGATFAEVPVASLALGGSQEVSADLLVVGERVHRVRVVADPDNAMREQSEDNNAAEQQLQVQFQGPDLTIAASGIAFSDANPGTGDTITVTLTISNVGNRTAAASVARLSDDGAAFADVDVPTLASGQAAQVSASLLAEGVRTHTVEAVVDATDALVEENEANNAASRALVVSFFAPDLTLGSSDIAFSDPNPDDLDTLTVTATVHNRGSPGRTASDVLVELLDQGAVVASGTVGSIASGSAASVDLSYVITDVGKRSLTVRLDEPNATWELDETNNEAARDIVVGKVLATVGMAKDVFALDEAATGVAHLQFRNTGVPLAGKEFTIPVEYIVRPGPAGPSVLDGVAAVLAQVNGDIADHLRVCAAGTCVDATLGEAIDLARTLGGGVGAGPGGAEFRFRVATLEARTNLRGDAGFQVPMSLLGALQALQGDLAAQVCVTGADDVFAAAGVDPCQGQAAPLPALPEVANLPGDYRATASVDWFGFGFAGFADYQHSA
ncbi:MAG TPA: CARDB domain-containing protein [Candidatus Thermoplasmatota archaeon]|jgi:subtilase family serine protease|nr:CARDB domain-containing protein [Candidatus Thermoplasmatota archaeon]